MIANVSMNSYKPSFGMARLTKTGIEAAQKWGMPLNDGMLNPALFKRPKGFAKQTALIKELPNKSFTEIANDYGCSNNPISNKDFIKKWILSKKGEKILKLIPDETDKAEGLKSLLDKNYDNKLLHKKPTLKLLELCKPFLDPEAYIKVKSVILDAYKK